jgi:hypothetical protein
MTRSVDRPLNTTLAHASTHRRLAARKASFPSAAKVPLAMILCVSALVWYVTASADRVLFDEAGVSLVVQIATWGACIIAAVRATPTRTLRISNPLVLTLIVSAVYLIYPSITWCQGERMPYGIDIDGSTASQLFYLHTLFFIGITTGYVFAAPRKTKEVHLDPRNVPGVWMPLLLGTLPLLLTAAYRVVNGGSLISTATYGEEWFQMQSSINGARASGGVQYLLVQTAQKMAFYVIVAQGIAWGLLLVRSARSPGKQLCTLALICGSAVVMILLGNGSRSPAMISVLIALVFADLTTGKLTWRILVPLGAAGMVCFLMLGYFRVYRDLGFYEALHVGYEEYQRSRSADAASEFTVMLVKEAVTLEIAHEKGFEGGAYLVHGVLVMVPIQLIPGKANWAITRDLLSTRLLGRSAELGSGVAGTAVGDGYLFAGETGVFALAGLFGIILGRVRTWGMHGPRVHTGPVFLKLVLLAGFTGFCYVLIRSDLGEVLTCVVYTVVIPWWVLSGLLAVRSAWLAVVPLSAPTSVA